jgi:predicted HTH domain antitoxin
MNGTLSVDYPETLPDAPHMSRAEFEREARLAMAAKLFETGRLSSGQAAGLIGMGRVTFPAKLGRSFT